MSVNFYNNPRAMAGLTVIVILLVIIAVAGHLVSAA
jgi:hypothetical protein